MEPIIDESLLTAYAIGELSGAERATVAAYLAGHPEARQLVADIRASANLIGDELTRESFGGLTDLQYASIEVELERRMKLPVRRTAHTGVWRDRAMFVMSLAASVAIVFGVLGLMFPYVYSHVYSAMNQNTVGPATQPSQPLAVEHHGELPTPVPAPKTPVAPVKPDQLAVKTPTQDDLTAFDQESPLPLPDVRVAVEGTGVEELALPPAQLGPVAGVSKSPALPKPPLPLTHVDPNPHPPVLAVETTNPLQQKARDNFASLNAGSHRGDAVMHLQENPFVDTAVEAASGFSAGVDTASYSNIRRYLTHGKLPPKDAVRIEEMLNYFPIRALPAAPAEGPLTLSAEVAVCPWKLDHRLARVSLAARDLPVRPAVNLVFVVDVSTVMRSDKSKLPMLKQALHLLAGKLTARDRISLVAYTTEAGVVLPPTAPDDKRMIWSAIDRLETGGKTNGGQGIEVAYDLVSRNLLKGGVNRVILCTDGNWNIGATEPEQLARIVGDLTHDNISLTVLGVGMDNLKEPALQKLAAAGNGTYAFIDTLDEARKVLIDQMNGTLVSGARDVKVQIAFNPNIAKSYRLIGYERRELSRAQLASANTAGGELGAGQSVTALYEVELVDLKKAGATRPQDLFTALATFTEPATSAVRMISTNGGDFSTPLPRASAEFRFAAAVAEFGLVLRDSDYKGSATYDTVYNHALLAGGFDDAGYRREFVKLVARARALATGR